MTSTSLAKNHLAHPPITLFDVVTTNDHEVPRADIKERGVSFDGEDAVINGHLLACNTYVLIAKELPGGNSD